MSEMAEGNRPVKKEEEKDQEEEEQEDEGQEYQGQEDQEEDLEEEEQEEEEEEEEEEAEEDQKEETENKKENQEEEEEEANFEYPTRPDEHISFLRLPVIKPGKAYIYPLWKFLLSRWLSKSGRTVYLATPFLDVKRMTDICNIVSKNPDTANIGAFFVRRECSKIRSIKEKNITEIIEAATRNIQENKYSILENKIFQKIFLQMPNRCFHAKFIGCTHNETAKVLVTSANLTTLHFDTQNYESVVYHEMTKAEFTERFLVPFGSITEHMTHR